MYLYVPRSSTDGIHCSRSLLPVVMISPLTNKVVSQVVLNVLYKPVASESKEDLLARM